jgi:hypothetical protein
MSLSNKGGEMRNSPANQKYINKASEASNTSTAALSKQEATEALVPAPSISNSSIHSSILDEDLRPAPSCSNASMGSSIMQRESGYYPGMETPVACLSFPLLVESESLPTFLGASSLSSDLLVPTFASFDI